MSTPSGRFRELVAIERPRRVRNQFNESEIEGWDLVAHVFAEIAQPTSPDRAHEVDSASRPASERLLQFKLRLPVDLQDSDRFDWNGDKFGIEGRLPDPSRGEMLVTGRFLSGTDGR